MAKICLIHWKDTEIGERAVRLEHAGHEVMPHSDTGGIAALRALRDEPPDAFVIDLGRLPSHGRDVAVWLRRQKPTRHVPLVFIEGDPAKTDRLRKLLPDAAYTDWAGIGKTLEDAIANPPSNPVTPGTMDSYASTPLPKKLGIRAGACVKLINAPQGFEESLGELPEGASFTREEEPGGTSLAGAEEPGGTWLAGDKEPDGASLTGKDESRPDLILWFVASRRELERNIVAVGAGSGKGGVWIAWPKKASGVPSDLTQQVVRETGLASGLVDYKICSVDETWSALRFARRKR